MSTDDIKSRVHAEHARGQERTPENAYGAIGISDEAVRAFRFYPVAIQENGCWHYTGTYGNEGYGFVYSREPGGKKRTFLAHRVAYHIFNGSIPNGMLICHACDNPKCVNPKHLFAGTNQDNMDDITNKGRRRKGSTHPHAKLNEDKVRAIRVQLAKGLEIVQVARDFEISRTVVSNIKHGRLWKHVV